MAQKPFGFHGGHAPLSRSGNGLAEDFLLHIACDKDAGNGCGGAIGGGQQVSFMICGKGITENIAHGGVADGNE